VADEQQTPIGSQASQLGECLASVEAACKRRMQTQQTALLCAPVLGSHLSGLTRACLGAEQDCIEARLQALERHSGRMSLSFTTLGQTALRVHACAVGLGVSVT